MPRPEPLDIEAEIKKLDTELTTYAIVERFDDNGENRGVFFIEISPDKVPHLNEIITNFTRDFLKDEGRYLTLAKIPKGAFAKFEGNAYKDRITFSWKGEQEMDEVEIVYYRFGNPSLFFK